MGEQGRFCDKPMLFISILKSDSLIFSAIYHFFMTKIRIASCHDMLRSTSDADNQQDPKNQGKNAGAVHPTYLETQSPYAKPLTTYPITPPPKLPFLHIPLTNPCPRHLFRR